MRRDPTSDAAEVLFRPDHSLEHRDRSVAQARGHQQELSRCAGSVQREDPPETIDTGFYWYDATNIDDEEIQAVLYE